MENLHLHPFARAMSPGTGDYAQDSLASKRRLLDAFPYSADVPPLSRPRPTRADVGHAKVPSLQLQRRPSHRMTIQDTGVTLTLNGQEDDASMPVYGRGATVDGTVRFSQPSSIIKVEVKMDGHVIVQELAGSGSTDTTVLSELLVFWDAPNRIGGYGSSSAAGDFLPVPGSCPSSFSFKATLPTHYLEPDGSTHSLPPSFCETFAGMPGFRCVVRYSIDVRVTRVRDVKVKSLRAQWKRNTVFRTPVEYRPRTKPSLPAPFPLNAKPWSSVGPVTRFDGTMKSGSPFVEQVRTMLYLPNSQVTPLTSSIPFFLRITGPEPVIDCYSRPPLSSFLPKAGPEHSMTICGVIGHVVNEGIKQNAKLAKVLSFQSQGNSSSWSLLSNHAENEKESEKSEARSTRRTRDVLPSTGVYVTLVRKVSVRAFPDSDYWSEFGHGHKVSSEMGPEANSDTEPEPMANERSQNGYDESNRGGSWIHKRTVIGEGVMYTASASRGRVTFAGDIHIDPRFCVRTGEFRTANLMVRDMLVITLKEPNLDWNTRSERPFKRRLFQQVIPLHLTTDAFE